MLSPDRSCEDYLSIVNAAVQDYSAHDIVGIDELASIYSKLRNFFLDIELPSPQRLSHMVTPD